MIIKLINKIFMNVKNLFPDLFLFDNWEEKYQYIIDLGNDISISLNHRIDRNLVNGCLSKVWLISNKKGDKFFFSGYSEALIVRGLLAIIFRIFSNKTAIEIIEIDFKLIFNTLGLKHHISEIRSNGMLSIIAKIKSFTGAY